MNCYLGLDIGTSGCKAIAFDEHGVQMSASYREYDVISLKPGWAELDTDLVVEKCFEAIRETASGLRPGSVKGIGISSQGEAFTLVDSRGQTICNALVSSDTRAHKYTGGWAEQFGKKRLYSITGHTPHPMFSLFKLLWIKHHRPEVWAKAARIYCFEDLIQMKLGVKEPAMGWPLAGRTMLFDVTSHCWSREILDAVGMKENQLSKPLQAGSIAGYVGSDAARALGLPDNTLVVTGGHDQPCAAFGAGAIDPGIAVYSIGTVDCITPAFNKAVFSDSLFKSNLCTYDHTVPGMYATVAFSLTGGNIIKWFRDNFGITASATAGPAGCDPYDLLLGQLPKEPTNLLVLPYFTPSGTPYFDTAVKGTILGLDLTTKREDLLKALLEGVAFEMRLNLEILEQSGCMVNELRAIGGGAKSKILCQLKADVTGRPIVVLNVKEAGCMGMAMLAMAADQRLNAREIAKQWVKPLYTLKPDTTWGYDAKYALYKELFPKLKANFYNQA